MTFYQNIRISYQKSTFRTIMLKNIPKESIAVITKQGDALHREIDTIIN